MNILDPDEPDFLNIVTKAVAINSLNKVKELFTLGYDFKKWDRTGNLPQHWINSVEMAKFFIENKLIVDINLLNHNSETILSKVVNTNYIIFPSKLINFLIDHGANINIKNNFCESLLHIAVNNNDRIMYNFLLKKGVNPNETNVWGRKAIFRKLM
jgi:ankyrin repeat protein